MFLAFKLYFFAVLSLRSRCEIIEQEKNSRWVKQLATGEEE
jgi:hypothetical protein